MLIVEDGTLVQGANSYVSLADADVYCVSRGLWGASPIVSEVGVEPVVYDPAIETKKEQALVRAFDYLNGLQWKGFVAETGRTTAWPRNEVPVCDSNGKTIFLARNVIPLAIISAQIEMAVIIYGGTDPLAPIARGGKVVSESHSKTEGSLDVIGGDSVSDSYTYASGAPTETFYPSVMGLIMPFLLYVNGLGGGVQIEAGRG